MAELLKGLPVAKQLDEKSCGIVEALAKKGITPCLCIVRVGDNEADIAYENSAVKKLTKLGMKADRRSLAKNASQEELEQVLRELSNDSLTHGILLMRPLPKSFDEAAAVACIAPEKDIDGASDISLARVFKNSRDCFAPCTAQAVASMIDYYLGDISGKRAVVVGRSLVIGKPVAMLLLERNATVTVAHSRTADLAGLCRDADIVVAAIGRAKMIGKDYTKYNSYIFDVGINVIDGVMCGDVDTDSVMKLCAGVTPVPGGVGSVTSSTLAFNVAQAAERTAL